MTRLLALLVPRTSSALLPMVLLLPLAACADEETTRPAPPSDAPERATTPRPLGEAEAARVDLQPFDRGGVTGTAQLVGYDEGVRVVLRAEGLEPGLHGVAVRDAADCAEAATSRHFDPTGAPHGDPEDPRPLHHTGDLGNARASGDGTARMDRVFTALRLDGPTSVVGRILVVHAGQDDLNTQPDGGAGTPIACGVIEPAE